MITDYREYPITISWTPKNETEETNNSAEFLQYVNETSNTRTRLIGGGLKSYRSVPPTERMCATSGLSGMPNAATSSAIERACQKICVYNCFSKQYHKGSKNEATKAV